MRFKRVGHPQSRPYQTHPAGHFGDQKECPFISSILLKTNKQTKVCQPPHDINHVFIMFLILTQLIFFKFFSLKPSFSLTYSQIIPSILENTYCDMLVVEQ
jgi:hypothetical protein